MLPAVLATLRCPHCGGPLAEAARALRCPAGHAFDVARQGHVNFVVGRPSGRIGDDAAMVAARDRVLAAGHFAPLARALCEEARPAAGGIVVEVGAGTGWYLAQVLDGLPGREGLAVDLSVPAARRAARVHPRAAAVVADVQAGLPVAAGCAALVLDVFAPRPGAELRRIVRDDGELLVATPAAEHLAELRGPLGLLDVDPEKARRVEAALAPAFERVASRTVEWTLALPRADALALAAMGPSARHVAPEALARRAAALREPFATTARVRVERWRAR